MDNFAFDLSSFGPQQLGPDLTLPELMSIGELRVGESRLPAVAPILWSESVALLYQTGATNAVARVVNDWCSQLLLQAWGRLRIFVYNPSIETEFPALEAAAQIHNIAGVPSPIVFLRNRTELGSAISQLKNETANRKARVALGTQSGWKTLAATDGSIDFCIIVLSDIEQQHSSQFSSEILDLIANGPRFGILCWSLVNGTPQFSSHHEHQQSQRWTSRLLEASTCVFDVSDQRIRIRGEAQKYQPFSTYEEFGGVSPSIFESEEHKTFCVRVKALISHEKEDAKTDFLDIRIGKKNGQDFNLRLGPGAEVYHGMLAGGTGKGKTVFLKNIIVSACETYTPEQINFHIFDFKDGVDLACFAGIKHVAHVHTECSEPYAVIRALRKFVAEAQRRNKAFMAAQLEGYAGGDLSDYNKWAATNGRDTFAYQLLIIDETARLFMMVKGDFDLQRNLIDLLMQVAMVGRSPGLSLLIASQSFSDLPGQVDGLRGHMKLRMSLQLSRPSDCYGIFAPGNNAAYYELKSTKQTREILVNYEDGKTEGNQTVLLDKMDHADLLPRILAVKEKWPGSAETTSNQVSDVDAAASPEPTGGMPPGPATDVHSWFPDAPLPDYPKK